MQQAALRSSPGGMCQAAHSSRRRQQLEQESGARRQRNRLPLGGSPLQRFHFMTFFHSTRGGWGKKAQTNLGFAFGFSPGCCPSARAGFMRTLESAAGSSTESCLSEPFVLSDLPALPLASSVLPAASLFLPLSPSSSLHLLSFRPSIHPSSDASHGLCCSSSSTIYPAGGYLSCMRRFRPFQPAPEVKFSIQVKLLT